MPFVLDDRAVIAVAGDTARDFLQGLITNDMAACTPARPIYAALLTPQGKVLFDFLVFEKDNAFLLDCAAATADDLLRRLTMYRLRAKIELRRRDDLAVAVAWDDSLPDAPDDPRLAALRKRTIVPHEPDAMVDAPAFHRRRLSLGVPDSADMPTDTVFPLDMGFEELHGVSFKKGCFVGQEVTARMKHRGTARRRVLMADFARALPPPGTALAADGKEIATLMTGLDHRALALVRLDRLDDARAANAEIMADGQRVTLVKPDWLSL